MQPVKELSVEATGAAWASACAEMGINPDNVPQQYIDLAALVSRRILDAFCGENGLELPELTIDDRLQRLMTAGVIDDAQAQELRERWESLDGSLRN